VVFQDISREETSTIIKVRVRGHILEISSTKTRELLLIGLPPI